MRTDRQRKRLDPIVQRIGAHGIDADHAVGQVHGGPSRLKKNADIADGGVDILHLRIRLSRRNYAEEKKDCSNPI